MWRTFSLFVLLLIVAWFLALLQFSLIDPLPGFWGQINLVFLSLAFILFFASFDEALIFSLMLGLSLDIFSFSPFGFYLFLLPFLLIGLHFIMLNWLTNRSFYSWTVLVLIALLLGNLLQGLLTLFLSAISPESVIFIFAHGYFWVNLAWQLLAGLLIAIFSFNLMSIVSRRLKPFFLAKR